MKKKTIIIAAVAVIAAAAIAVAVVKARGEKPLEVQTAEASLQQVVQKVNATGKVQPKTQVQISADVSARIMRLGVKEGHRVEQGQFLVELDREAYLAKDQFSFGLNLAKGENGAIIVDGLWTGGPSDKAGIKVGENIVACNGRPFNGDAIFQLRRLISDEKVEEVRLVLKNGDTRREVLLRKEMLLSRGHRQAST